jgi:hypothetical protein
MWRDGETQMVKFHRSRPFGLKEIARLSGGSMRSRWPRQANLAGDLFRGDSNDFRDQVAILEQLKEFSLTYLAPFEGPCCERQVPLGPGDPVLSFAFLPDIVCQSKQPRESKRRDLG